MSYIRMLVVVVSIWSVLHCGQRGKCWSAEPQPSLIVHGGGWAFYGQIGALIELQGRLYCEPSADLKVTWGTSLKPVKLPLDKRQEESRKNYQESNDPYNLLLNEQGELIVGNDITAKGQWHAEISSVRSRKLKLLYSQDPRDEVVAFTLEHLQGVNGKRYVTLSPELETITIHLADNKKLELKVHRLVMTDDEKNRGYFWYKISGK